MKNLLYSFFTGIILFSSCSKTGTEVVSTINPLDTITNFNGILNPTPGTLNLSFEHYFKTSPLVYGTQNYVSDANDTMVINSLSYRISNVQLFDALNKKWVDIGTYRLNPGIDASKFNIAIPNVPAGLYNNIRFNIGVDSLRNHEGEQTGDLDPALGMYWSWTNGYIHFKLEGRNNVSLNTFSIHIGGSKNVANPSFDLSNYKIKNTTSGIQLSYKLDVNGFLSKPNLYDLKTNPTDIHNENVPQIKTKLLPNMLQMFVLTDVKNN